MHPRARRLHGLLFVTIVWLGAAVPIWAQGIPTPAQIADAIQQLGAESGVGRKAAREFLAKHAARAWTELNEATESEDPEVRLAAREILGKVSAVDRRKGIRWTEERDRAAKGKAERKAKERKARKLAEGVGSLVAAGPDGWKKIDALLQASSNSHLVSVLELHHYPQHLIAARTEQTDEMLERYLLCALGDSIWLGVADYATYHALRGTLAEMVEGHEEKLQKEESKKQKRLVKSLHAWVKAYEAPPPPLPTASSLELARRPRNVSIDQLQHFNIFSGTAELECRAREGNEKQVAAMFRSLVAHCATARGSSQYGGAMKKLAICGLPGQMFVLAQLLGEDGRQSSIGIAKAQGLLARAARLERGAPAPRQGSRSSFVSFALDTGPAERQKTVETLAARLHEGKDIWPDVKRLLADEASGFNERDLGTQLYGHEKLRWFEFIGVAYPAAFPGESLKRTLEFGPKGTPASVWRKLFVPEMAALDRLPAWFRADKFYGARAFKDLDRLGNKLAHEGVLGTVAPVFEELGKEGSAAAWYMAGEARRKLGEFPEGERAFREVLRARPTCISARVYLSHCLSQQGRTEAADKELQTARLMPLGSGKWRHWALVHALEDAGEEEAAERECELARRCGLDNILREARAYQLARHGRYGEAAALCLRAMFSGAYMTGEASYLSLDDYLYAAACIRRWQGRAALARGEAKEAARLMALAGRVHAREPFGITEDLALLASAGQTQARKTMLAHHLTRLRVNLAALPDDVACHSHLAWVLAVTGEDPQQAVSLIRRALELNAESREGKARTPKEAHYWRGQGAKPVPEAVKIRAYCHDVLAEAYSRLGKSREAAAAAEKALALTPPPGAPDYWVDHYHLPTPWDVRTARLKRLRAAK